MLLVCLLEVSSGHRSAVHTPLVRIQNTHTHTHTHTHSVTHTHTVSHTHTHTHTHTRTTQDYSDAQTLMTSGSS